MNITNVFSGVDVTKSEFRNLRVASDDHDGVVFSVRSHAEADKWRPSICFIDPKDALCFALFANAQTGESYGVSVCAREFFKIAKVDGHALGTSRVLWRDWAKFYTGAPEHEYLALEAAMTHFIAALRSFQKRGHYTLIGHDDSVTRF